jgi:outer membrane protein
MATFRTGSLIASTAMALLFVARPLWAQAPEAETSIPGLQEHAAPPATNPVLEAFSPQARGLTADLVARRASASSKTIAAKNAELRAAAAKVDSAMYQFLPRATLKAGYARVNKVVNSLGGGSLLASSGSGPYTTGDYTVTDPNTGVVTNGHGLIDERGSPVSGYVVSFPTYTNTYSLSASLSVPLSDYVLRMADSIRGTRLNRESAQLNVRAERAKVEGDARVAFFNWARALGQVAVTEKSLERVQARLQDVQRSFSVGMVTKASLLRMEALLAATQSALEEAKGFRNLAAQQLSVIMHDTQAEYTLGEDVLVPVTVLVEQSIGDLVAEAYKNRLELKAMEQSAASLVAAESVIKAGRYPRVDGFVDYTYANPNQRYMLDLGWHSSWSVGVQATWALNDILVNDASAREYRANREQLEANRDALAEGVRLEVASACTDQRKALAELQAAQRSSEASQAAYETSTQLYKVGKATTSELIDAEADLVTSSLRLINAHLDSRVAETRLAHATGRDLARLTN